ncbi:PLD nuclease N-terminal domain-containing protein [Streptomyces sp. NPDC090025]|uniref:PLD nuclease N-terminal domain-containing protein n=1 Tax=Streptomyces sp. NPDC090025 TaxID=3365922 RepID=UPI0038344485
MLRALMYILPLALTIYAFIDCLNTPEDEVKHLPKVVWVIIILLFWIVGPVVWFFAGKKRDAVAGGAGRRGGGWVAPDDNPEFLKSLREESRREPEAAAGPEAPVQPGQDEAALKDWEADLRRREEELKRRERGGDGQDSGKSQDKGQDKGQERGQDRGQDSES